MPTSTPMTTGIGVDLCAIWLNDTEDLTDRMAFRYAGEAINISSSKRVEVRQLASRRRLVSRDLKVYDSFSVTLSSVTAAQALWLRDHVGRLLVIRDHVGSKAFVAYTDAPREVGTDRYSMVRSSLKLTLDQIDYSEAV